MRSKYPLIFIFVMLTLSSCTALKFVPEQERLYTGAKVDYVHANAVKDKSVAQDQVEEIIRPKPNSKLLGNRMRLWIWYKAEKRNRKKDTIGWVQRKLGEPPVYLSQVNPDIVTKAINASLYNKGFFDSHCSYEIVEFKKTAQVRYTIVLADPYHYRDIKLPTDSSFISNEIRELSAASLIKTKDRYDLDILIEERQRIDNALKEKGYYFFSDKYISFRMDTALGKREADLFVSVKDRLPQTALKPFRVNKISVFTDFPMAGDTTPVRERVTDSIHFYQRTNYIKRRPLGRTIFFAEGRMYSRSDHNLTLNRLSDLGVFKYVNLKINAVDSANNNLLDINIQLVPHPKKSIGIEVTGTSKSNNFLGPSVGVRFRNRNALRGAELLLVNVAGGLETQLNGPFSGQFTYEFNPKVEFYVPRFLMPKFCNRFIKVNSMFVPKTKFILDYSYTSRVNYFNIQSTRFGFGYKWKTNLAIDHDLGVFNVNYFNIYNESAGFKELVESNIFLRRRFEKQFIEGITYAFMYNEQVLPKKKNPIYFSINSEVAGTLLAIANAGKARVNNEPHQFLGVNYSQFVRLELEIRKYFRLDKYNRRYFATRAIAGWGLPYGNSTTMPYIKQFFSGGAYSVRGFPAFSLGPGTYYPPDSLQSGFAQQQGGEIKLEGNIEYRFSFSNMLKGAFFVDVGNTWLNRPNSVAPGGEFKMNSFYTQMAVGSGFGLRFDIEFIVFRLDLGIPIRKPWFPEGDRWVFSNFDIGSGAWRRDNLILNIAFGYPF